MQPENSNSGFDLSPQQRRLWLLQRDGAAYRVQAAVSIGGAVDSAALRQACEDVVRRHEILRTSFQLQNGARFPTQVVNADATVHDVDMTRLSLPEQEAAFDELFAATLRSPLPSNPEPLPSLTIAALSGQQHALLIALPALCADNATLERLLSEIAQAYTARVNGRKGDEECLQYADLSTWLNELLESEETKTGREYWLKQSIIHGAQPTHLPFEKRPAVGDGFAPRFINARIERALTKKLSDIAEQEQTTLHLLLLAAWKILLSRLTGKPEVLVGMAYDGRRFEETRHALGMLTKYLPIQSHLAEIKRTAELLRQLNERAGEIEKWQEYFSWEQLADTHANGASAPFFSILFDFHRLPNELRESGLTFSLRKEYSCLDRFKIKLSCIAHDDVLDLQFYYDPAYFDADCIERIARQFQQLTKSLAAGPEIPIGELELLDEFEREQLLVAFNRTDAFVPDDKSVQQLFEEQVERTPQSVAVMCKGQSLSYAALNARANQLAHLLRRKGVSSDVRVGLCLDRSVEMLVGLLAVLKAGGAYVPLNHEHPQARLRYQLTETAAPVLLTQEKLLDHLPANFGGELICLDRDRELFEREPEINLPLMTGGQFLAYVIYTSGSTGVPKGVAVSRQGLLNYTLFICSKLGIRDRVPDSQLHFATVSTISADLGNTCIFPSLVSGGCLHVLDYDTATDAGLFADYVAAQAIDVLKIVPSHLSSLLASANGRDLLPRKYLFMGGESLPFKLLERVKEQGGACRVINHYGPTEATVGALTCEADEVTEYNTPSATVPIGRPVANTSAYVLDEYFKPVPVGVEGELYLGGEGLARGYVNEPQQTAALFVPNPFSTRPGARLYRTGDHARFLPDGRLEFLGRRDAQVKVRGFRIELGEIETALQQHDGVRQCVVAVRGEAGAEETRLVAYVVCETELSGGVLQHYLRERVPDYMVPSNFVMLERLPLTPNGKVDRRALALLATSVSATESGANHVAARNEVEAKLAEIWRDVLRCEREVGIHDNFFELGGDSILSIQIMARATQAGLRLTPRQLFEHPTIAQLAEVAGTTKAVTAEQGTVTGSLPLTPIQRSFFAHHAAYPQHWNMALMLEVRERRYTAQALREALRAIVAHHDALRLRFKFDGESWQQWNAESETNEFFTTVDFTHLAQEEQSRAIEEHAAGQQASLNLSEGPLLRVCYYEMGEGAAARLLIIIHHLAVDGVSWRILLEDLASGCEQAARQQQQKREGEIKLGAKTTSYKEWAERLQKYAQGAEVTRQREYWRTVAARARQVKRLPLDVEGSEPQVGTTRAVSVELSQTETEALLSEVPKVYRTEINDVLLTALVEAIKQWTGQRRVVVEMEGHGREEIGEGVDVTRTVGWFTTHYPVVVEVEEGVGIGEALKAVKEELRGVPEHGLGWGLWRWMRADTEAREAGEASESGVTGAGREESNVEEVEAEISFNYLGQFDQVLGEGAAFVPARESAGPEQSPTGKRNRLLSITGRVSGGRLLMNWSYSEAVHGRETIERVTGNFTSALRKIIAHCQSPEAGGYTPSDFPETDLSQSELDDLMASIGQADMQDGEEYE